MSSNNHDREHRNPKITSSDITHLKEWISKRPDLPQKHDDVWLENFLWGCECSLERCKERLELLYTVRLTMPDMFSNRDPLSETMKNYTRIIAMTILPKPAPNNLAVGFGKLLDVDPAKFDYELFVKRVTAFADFFIRENRQDVVVVLDLNGVTMSHIVKIPINLAIDGAYCVQEVLPIRLKGIYIINPPTFIEVALRIFYPFLSSSFKNMIHVLENVEDLYVTVPQDILPQEYGGTAETMEELNEKWQLKMESERDWFLEEASKKIDKSKVSGKYFNYLKTKDTFGTGGSFRSLSVD